MDARTIAVFSMFAGICGDDSTPTDTGTTTPTGPIVESPYEIDASFDCSKSSAALDVNHDVTVAAASLKSDGLIWMDLEYKGGCATHEVQVCFNKFFNSSTAETELYVLYDDGGEWCYDEVEQAVGIDVSAIRQAALPQTSVRVHLRSKTIDLN